MLAGFGLLAFHTHDPDVLHGFFDRTYPGPLLVMENIIDSTLVAWLGREVASYVLAGLAAAFAVALYRKVMRGEEPIPPTVKF